MSENANGKAINWEVLFSKSGPVVIGLLLLTGGGTFFNVAELNQALKEIHELHSELFDAISRQKQIQQQLDQLSKK